MTLIVEEPAIGLPVPQWQHTVAPRPTKLVVQVPLESIGGLRFQEDSYYLVLQNIMSRAEFADIIRDLNKTCDAFAPNIDAHKAVMAVPLLGRAAVPVLLHKMARLKQELSATCLMLNKLYAYRGMNFRVVEIHSGKCPRHCNRRCRQWCYAQGISSATYRVEMEVAL